MVAPGDSFSVVLVLSFTALGADGVDHVDTVGHEHGAAAACNFVKRGLQAAVSSVLAVAFGAVLAHVDDERGNGS